MSPVLRPMLAGLLAVLPLAASAGADEGPSYDCARAEGAVQDAICASADLSALDRRLAEVWGEAMAVAEDLDAPPDLDALRAEQRGWIKGRDACWKADDLAACAASAYRSRISELSAAWRLAPQTGAARWVCGENPADEVRASFHDTPIPSARIERGDTVRVGLLARTASGARYDMPFGASLWIKGEEARLEWTEGDAVACRAAP